MYSSTKENILHEASRLLLSKGFNGFSLQDLAANMGIKKASLFHHYPSKTALIRELYLYYQHSFIHWSESFSHLDPEKQIINYVSMLTHWICLKKRICPMSALSIEWDLMDKTVQREVIQLHRRQKKWLTKLFKKIHQEKGLRLPVNQAVIQTMCLIQGSVQLARINANNQLAINNIRFFLKAIKKS